MGLFYAYTISIAEDHFKCYRYLMTFPSCEVADEWWRMVSSPSSALSGVFQRLSPQYYTHNYKDNLGDFILRQRDGKKFMEKMFLTLLHDRDSRVQSIFPPQDTTDHISGNWFYIRSKSDPRRHWYCRVDGACAVCGGGEDCNIVHVSTERRSRFCVRARDEPTGNSRAPTQLIMIGSDQITIAPSKEYVLHINDAEELKATRIAAYRYTDMLFSDLQDRFWMRTERTEDGAIISVSECVVSVERRLGEPWELVA